MATTMPARQTVSAKNIILLPQTHVTLTTMGIPRCRPRRILKDSLFSLVPNEGTGRVPSHTPDSEKETDNKRGLVLVLDRCL